MAEKAKEAGIQHPKVQEAEKLVNRADKLIPSLVSTESHLYAYNNINTLAHIVEQCRTKLGIFNWSADWATATPLYEQAANSYKLAKMPEQAKLCFEKAAAGQERLSSPWTAGKHMESAGALAKETGFVDQAIEFYRRASDLFLQCGKVQPSGDALVRGARAVEDERPEVAVKMYIDACAMLEEDGREQMAFDAYRAAVNVYIKLERFQDAATVLMRWGQAAAKCSAHQSQCKAYLSAIITYLYADDVKQAQQCYNDCSQMDLFCRSDQGQCAEQLLSAYHEGRSEDIQHLVKTSNFIPHLDHMVVRLANQLPKGGVKPSEAEPSVDDLDENDLT